jgi:hypothetical protein
VLNKVIDGISVKLNQIFGNEYEIYSEIVKQDLKEPCFFIMPISFSINKKLNKHYKLHQSFDIHYFPSDTTDKNKEMQIVGIKLTEEMEYLTVDGMLVKGNSIRFNTVDDILHFFINYDIGVYIPHNDVDMQTLIVNNE